ncbi:outer membrane beta-barrel protein [Thalassotalea ponticola]|uniref:outer membrane beta-barrel protein n=1 Tax=Thalassotalea ponticola TaxID=1523392 RepID=UPI0025B500BB|nr:outer membrane beta-barrel protein [Thalassotalea ponticola]
MSLSLISPKAMAWDDQQDIYAPAQQHDSFYFGLQVGQGIHNSESFNDFNISAYTGRLGYNHTNHLGFEVRLGQSWNEDDIGNGDRELDQLTGLYVTYSYPINRKLNIFGVAGVSDVDINWIRGENVDEYNESGPSLGGGLEYVVNNKARWTLEAMAYVESDINYGNISGGFRISF